MRAPRPAKPKDVQLELPPPRPADLPGSLTIFIPLTRTKSTLIYETYWRFAWERQEIFFRRLRGEPPPWTHDPILQKHKFTNVYRACDRVSQYLIREVIYKGDKSPKEVFFRTMVFKLFNRIETWELLQKYFKEISFSHCDFAQYDALLSTAIDSGARLYSAAYIMPSGAGGLKYPRKHKMHLWLLEKMMKEDLPARLADAKSMQEAFE